MLEELQVILVLQTQVLEDIKDIRVQLAQLDIPAQLAQLAQLVFRTENITLVLMDISKPKAAD